VSNKDSCGQLMLHIEQKRLELLALWKKMSAEEHAEVYESLSKRTDEEYRKLFPKAPRSAVHGDVYENDGSMITIDDSEGQRLWVRVGSVFDGSKTHKQPGIWINYQEKALESPMTGPVLLSSSVWRRLNKAIEKALTR